MSGPSVGPRAVRKARWAKSRLASRYSMSIGRVDPDLIFIAGTGRSGTTWLAELLARNSRRRLVFEPFRNDRVPLWQDAARRQYIRPGDSDSKFLEPARQILAPSFRNNWADYYNGRLVTRGRIVKDIRANLILRWLYEQFGPFPVIFLIRHPGAVAASWLREGWTVEPSEAFLTQPALVEDHLVPFLNDIAIANDPFEKIVYNWCIETLVPLRQFVNDDVVLMFYEDLIRHPQRELARVSELVGAIQGKGQTDMFGTPSATTTPGVTYRSQSARLLAWRDRLSKWQIESVCAITSRFGLDLYGDDGMPCQVSLGSTALHTREYGDRELRSCHRRIS